MVQISGTNKDFQLLEPGGKLLGKMSPASSVLSCPACGHTGQPGTPPGLHPSPHTVSVLYASLPVVPSFNGR